MEVPQWREVWQGGQLVGVEEERAHVVDVDQWRD